MDGETETPLKGLMKHNIVVKVNIPFDNAEPEFCGDDCQFLVLGDGDDYCCLFKKDLAFMNEFPVRCKKCLKQTETKL